MVSTERLESLCAGWIPDKAFTLSTLPDSFQWARVLFTSCREKKNQLDSSLLKLKVPVGAVFTGEPGNGRHTTAMALCGSLYMSGKDYRKFVSLHGGDLDFEDPEDALAVLQYAVTNADPNGTVLLLDQPELSRHCKLLQRRLIKAQEQQRQKGIRIFVILITDDEKCLASETIRTYPRYHCGNPEEQAVRAYVKNMMQSPVCIWIERIKEEELVERLTGLSWKQIEDFHSCLLRLLLTTYVEGMQEKRYGASVEEEEKLYKGGLIVLSYRDVEPVLASVSAQRKALPQPVFAMSYGNAGSVSTMEPNREEEHETQEVPSEELPNPDGMFDIVL